MGSGAAARAADDVVRVRLAETAHERNQVAELIYESSRLQYQNPSYRLGILHSGVRVGDDNAENLAYRDRQTALDADYLAVLWTDENDPPDGLLIEQVIGSLSGSGQIASLSTPVEDPLMRATLAQYLNLSGFPQAVVAISAAS